MDSKDIAALFSIGHRLPRTLPWMDMRITYSNDKLIGLKAQHFIYRKSAEICTVLIKKLDDDETRVLGFRILKAYSMYIDNTGEILSLDWTNVKKPKEQLLHHHYPVRKHMCVKKRKEEMKPSGNGQDQYTLFFARLIFKLLCTNLLVTYAQHVRFCTS